MSLVVDRQRSHLALGHNSRELLGNLRFHEAFMGVVIRQRGVLADLCHNLALCLSLWNFLGERWTLLWRYFDRLFSLSLRMRWHLFSLLNRLSWPLLGRLCDRGRTLLRLGSLLLARRWLWWRVQYRVRLLVGNHLARYRIIVLA